MKFTTAPGLSLGILLLASLKSASSGPVSRSRAIAILDLGGSSGSSYSKRVTLAVEQWAGETQNCSGKMRIRHKNRCTELASNFAPSCAENQWLVLEKPKKNIQSRYFPVKPKCVVLPCEFQPHRSIKQCVQITHEAEVCEEGKVLSADLFGDTYCGCPPGRGQLTEGADCHEYNQQGPCQSDEVLVFHAASGLGKCAPDLCYTETTLRAADEEKARSAVVKGCRKAFAPLNGTGPCLECEPREDRHEDVGLIIDEESNLSNCMRSGGCRRGVGISVPVCRNFDPITKKCPGKVTVEQGPQEAYVKANRGSFN